MKKLTCYIAFIFLLVNQAIAQQADIQTLKTLLDKYTHYEKDKSNEIQRFSNLKLTVKDCKAMYEVDEVFSVYSDKEYHYTRPHKAYAFDWKNLSYIKRINSGTLLLGFPGKLVNVESKTKDAPKAERSKVCFFEIYFKSYTQGTPDEDSMKAIELIKKIVKSCGGRDLVLLDPLDKVSCEEEE
jgi:hypothetical protein